MTNSSQAATQGQWPRPRQALLGHCPVDLLVELPQQGSSQGTSEVQVAWGGFISAPPLENNHKNSLQVAAPFTPPLQKKRCDKEESSKSESKVSTTLELESSLASTNKDIKDNLAAVLENQNASAQSAEHGTASYSQYDTADYLHCGPNN